MELNLREFAQYIAPNIQTQAKELWGDEPLMIKDYRRLETPRSIYPWQYHLARLVISDDPAEYLEDNLG